MRSVLFALLLLTGAAAHAAALTIDFEELPDQAGILCSPACTSRPASWETQGFTISGADANLTSDFPGGIYDPNNFGAANGSDRAMNFCAAPTFCGYVTFSFAVTGGGTFDLSSFDAAMYTGSTYNNESRNWQITGYYAGGGTVQKTISVSVDNGWEMQVFGNDWANLATFEITADGNFDVAMFDNVVVTNVVPIPAAVWLFASGLGVLGWLRRRKI